LLTRQGGTHENSKSKSSARCHSIKKVYILERGREIKRGLNSMLLLFPLIRDVLWALLQTIHTATSCCSSTCAKPNYWTCRVVFCLYSLGCKRIFCRFVPSSTALEAYYHIVKNFDCGKHWSAKTHLGHYHRQRPPSGPSLPRAGRVAAALGMMGAG
jgi:hypothetical protein